MTSNSNTATARRRRRKIVYTLAIVVLLMPILWLGLPESGGEADAGVSGKLADLRVEYDLGDSTLGKVDPESQSMSFLLLGFRAMATNMLWMQAQDAKQKKDWPRLASRVDSITNLQPHYIKVWDFQGWNLAYNVSAEWDGAEDKFYWVKRGIKFVRKGADRNQRYPDLYWHVGRMLGQKIGRADEWREFRNYFKKDPDVEKFRGRADDDLNPEGKDNYLVAKTYFQIAVDKDGNPVEQGLFHDVVFKRYPQQSLFDYADALQREGKFGERTQAAWARAHDEWKNIFGQTIFNPDKGGKIKLEIRSPEDVEALVALDEGRFSADAKQEWIARYQDLASYTYWREHSKAEADPVTAQAHDLIYQGQELFVTGKTTPKFYTLTGEGKTRLAELNSLEGRGEPLSQSQKLELAILRTLSKASEEVRIEEQQLEDAEFLGEDAAEVLLDEDGLLTDAASDLLLDLERRDQTIIRLSEAQLKLQRGMRKMAEVFEQYPRLESEDDYAEEALLAIRFWRANFEEKKLPIPNSYPLKSFWEKDTSQKFREQVETLYRRRLAGLR